MDAYILTSLHTYAYNRYVKIKHTVYGCIHPYILTYICIQQICEDKAYSGKCDVWMHTCIHAYILTYICIQQICEDKAYSGKCDVWSLGCTLYEMCALEPAFPANTGRIDTDLKEVCMYVLYVYYFMYLEVCMYVCMYYMCITLCIFRYVCMYVCIICVLPYVLYVYVPAFPANRGRIGTKFEQEFACMYA